MTEETHKEFIGGLPQQTLDVRPRDKKERVSPEHMSDHELLVETVTHLREVADAIEELAESPMIRALKAGQNPIMAMMGRG